VGFVAAMQRKLPSATPLVMFSEKPKPQIEKLLCQAERKEKSTKWLHTSARSV